MGFIGNPRRGGGLPGEGGEGGEGPGGWLRGISGGGGLNIFFRGRNSPPSKESNTCRKQKDAKERK